MARFFLGLLLLATVVLTGCSSSDATGTDEDNLGSCSELTQVLLWAPRDPLAPITKNLTPNLACTHYYVMLPLNANDKTNFHGNVATEIANVHNLGNNFHAVAEFNVSAWRKWIAMSPGTRDWHSAGVEFRKRMATAGFVLFDGQSDTWMIQEMPTTLVGAKNGIDPAQVRKDFIGAMRGLHDADGSLPKKKGGAFRAGHGQAMDSSLTSSQIDWILNSEKQSIEAWLEDTAFWNAADAYMRFWSEETYADPHVACVPGSSVGARANSISDYTFHVPLLADEGGAKTAAARAFFHKAYLPIMSAAWMNDVGYGNTNVSLDNMKNHVSTEIYAVKAFFSTHAAYTGQRIGFAWVPDGTNPADDTELGVRIANAIDDAYADGHGASYACSPSGAFTLCQCSVSGASFVPAWGKVFSTY